ncbi:SDR family NAD(P)-dependent oxidoreductase [uncultured Ilumatobacter sp.]|jgi:NAD(P)-dependent dehydrogenase (short-subunit alcohol dehydrogenase family)|uniref:SDR family NAD(P)-dependent oxidoreductase n=1 Tax=uncultured Ilumatobacter sp. TaxID=879968 RepID=UPI00374FC0E1
MSSDSPFDLTGRVALITGGNSGIGLGMAEGLAAHGADVAIWGTHSEKNERALDILSDYDVELLSIICDVSDEAAVIESMQETVDALGRIDAVFVNAGISGRSPSFLEMTSEDWRRVMSVNLDGAFYTAREAAKHMVGRFEEGDRSGGSIVFTSSGSSEFGSASGQHYGATKAGVNAMMRGIAVAHARHNIRCNSILPGWIESDMTANAFGWDKFVDKVMPRIPSRRWGTKEDFAGIATYLASSASSYHTGDIIRIDGGFHSF